jgi:nucleotide-binding universal stress UspA family protein
LISINTILRWPWEAIGRDRGALRSLSKQLRFAVALRILLPIMTYPDAAPEIALSRAVDFSSTLRAQMTAVIHEADIPPINSPVADFVLDLQKQAADAEQVSREQGQKLEQQLKLLCTRLTLPLVVERLKARIPCGGLMAAKARHFDMTMLVCNPESPDHALLLEDVLFGSGGPAVIFPAIDAPSHVTTIAIAWDGSRAAARAVHDAIPILKQAGRVRLLTCAGDKPISAASIDGITTLLAAHEIDAKHVSVVLNDRPVGDALQAAALGEDAGLMVMGAYGHSRLREFIMGGATTSVLRSPKLPIFMSH